VVRIVLVLLLALQLVPDPPHKCDDCADWNKPREPFKLFGNSFYVGTDGLSAVLVTGDAGHVLLDGGLSQSAPLIDANIRKLGFKTGDIKLILVSHGHFDHAGGVAALQRFTEATVAASPSTAQALQRGENTPDDPQFGFGKNFNGFPPTARVRVFRDGEVLTVGKTSITAHLIPGHAPGSTAYAWRSCAPSRPEAASAADEGTQCRNMVYADSLTSGSAPGFTYGPERLALFRRSIEKVAALPCDIVVSPHPYFTQLFEKQKRGSFDDPKGCQAYAADGLKRLEARIAEEKGKK
jgi:metallo-beta-lactamase class B